MTGRIREQESSNGLMCNAPTTLQEEQILGKLVRSARDYRRKQGAAAIYYDIMLLVVLHN